MRRSILIFALMFGSFATVSVQAQDAKETKQKAVVRAAEKTAFQVNGECWMCKNRIEKAAQGLEGVQLANWNVERKVLRVKYDPAKVTEADIQKQVASVGHDTEQAKATDEAYNSLPGCCKYERK